MAAKQSLTSLPPVKFFVLLCSVVVTGYNLAAASRVVATPNTCNKLSEMLCKAQVLRADHFGIVVSYAVALFATQLLKHRRKASVSFTLTIPLISSSRMIIKLNFKLIHAATFYAMR